MKIKNYTSGVPISETVNKIERILISCKVLGIAKEYSEGGEVTALTFGMPYEGHNVAVRLPVEIDACQESLWQDYVDGETVEKISNGTDEMVRYNGYKRKKRSEFRDQAERTAWKLAQDWLEVELSRVKLRQGSVAQIFMPYIWDPRSKQTLFEKFKGSGGFKALPEHAS
jgi:hypothetical protein